MAKRLSSDVYRQLDAICRGGTTSGLTDAELIDRFVGRTDRAVAEAAFEAIIRRHGPMVLGICRKIVRDPTDAEDAFQATFLVLSRKAGSVRIHDDDSLGRWLFGTARRVATRASKQAKRRRDAERGAVPEMASAAPGPAESVIARERAALVREEVARLPERYRAAVELCHLDGRSIDEASAQLGQPSGTIKVHLMRARALLRDRLSRRGFSTTDMPMPIVPAVLVHRTVRLVAVDAFGSATVPGLSAMGTGAALKLAEGVLTMMGWAKVQGAGAAVLCVGLGAATVGGWVVGEGEGGGFAFGSGEGPGVVLVADDEGSEEGRRAIDQPESSEPEKEDPLESIQQEIRELDAYHQQLQKSMEEDRAALIDLQIAYSSNRDLAERVRRRLDQLIDEKNRIFLGRQPKPGDVSPNGRPEPPLPDENRVREPDTDPKDSDDLSIERLGDLIPRLRTELQALGQQRELLDGKITGTTNRLADLERRLEGLRDRNQGDLDRPAEEIARPEAGEGPNIDRDEPDAPAETEPESPEQNDLALLIDAPDEVLLGRSFMVSISVSNRGDRPVRDRRIFATISEGLKGFDTNGQPVEVRRFEELIGLDPGARFGPVPLKMAALGEGEHTIRFEVVGEGIEAGTVAEEVTVTVVRPGLNLKLFGPDRAMNGSVVDYSLVVYNSGTATATDVAVALFAPDRGRPEVPAGATYRQDTDKRLHSMNWRFPKLEKGELKQVRVPIRLDHNGRYTVEAAAHSEGFRDQEDTRRDQFTTLVGPAGDGFPRFVEPGDNGVRPSPPQRSSFDADPPIAEGRSPFEGDPPMRSERPSIEFHEPVVADPFGPGRVQRSPFDEKPALPRESGAEGVPLPPETEVIDKPVWTLEQTTPRPADGALPPEYVIEPPDLIRVEVLEALPGRPITGERLVRPDGRISLGFYGDFHVEGLTPTEIKEKVVLHLRSFLNDETLGLIEVNSVTLKPIMIHPRDTNRVFVEVVAYNSKVVYVQGEVEQQGRLTLNGRETVLDVLIEAGGPKPGEGMLNVRLIRPSADEGGEAEIREVDWEGIVYRGDSRTNHEVKPGDRIVVERESDPVALEKRIEQQFLSNPEVRAFREKIRAIDAQIYDVSKSVNNPNDPALRRLLDERDRIRLRIAELWTRMEPILRAVLASEKEPEPVMEIGEQLQQLKVELIDIDRHLETARRAAARSGDITVIKRLIEKRDELTEEYAKILENQNPDDWERLEPALRGVPGGASQGFDPIRNELVGLDDLLDDLREELGVIRAQPGSPQEETATELEAEIDRLESRRQELLELLEEGPDHGEGVGTEDREGGAKEGPEMPDQKPNAAEFEQGE